MRSKETVFDYLEQIFMVFGVTILCLCMLSALVGEEAKTVSTIFALGEDGLTIATILEFLLLSAIIITLRFVLFADGLIKKLPLAVRTIGMFTLVLLFIVLFSIWFGWFPVNMWQPWIMFFLCFGISAGVSTVLSVLKEKTENKRLEEALRRMKEGD